MKLAHIAGYFIHHHNNNDQLYKINGTLPSKSLFILIRRFFATLPDKNIKLAPIARYLYTPQIYRSNILH